MILYQPLHGTSHDGAEFHAEALGCLLELGGKGIGDGAYEVDGEPWAAILLDVAHEEGDEALDEEVVHLGDLTMLREEGGEAGEEAVGQGLAVDSL